MAEFLTFSGLGQWTLCKSDNPYGAAPKPDRPYRVYQGKARLGELHEDHGQKGTLRNFGAGHRPKPSWNKRHVDKIPHDMRSVTAERNPGLGETAVE